MAVMGPEPGSLPPTAILPPTSAGTAPMGIPPHMSPAHGARASSGFECRLDSAHDLAAILAALQLREKDQKEQRVHCEASARGLKLIAQSGAKDVAVLGWILSSSFKEYSFSSQTQEQLLHLRLPVAPLLSCLQIFSDRAGLIMRYPYGPSDDLYLSMDEDGAVTECRLKTLVCDEAPTFGAFFADGDPVSILRPARTEAWYQTLCEFQELDAPDAVLQVTLRAAQDPNIPAVVMRVQTITIDVEVELRRTDMDELTLSPSVVAAGQVTLSYPLSSVLASCLRAAKDAKAVKVRFNQDDVMSNQFILRSRDSRGRQELFCEALVSPLADVGQGNSIRPAAAPAATQAASCTQVAGAMGLSPSYGGTFNGTQIQPGLGRAAQDSTAF